jgi:uncharacterized protein
MMSARRAGPHVFLRVILAISLLSFAHSIRAQQCQMAHDKSALKTLQERAAAGDADAQCGLGKQYEHALGVSQDNTQAILWLRKAAEQGNIIAQVELGVVFDNIQDYAQAFTWYSKAAEQGNARAQYNLGLCYLNGESVPKDPARAVGLFRKAADQNDAIAQHELGVMYQEGTGIPQDYAQAANYFRKATEQGIAESQYGLGFLYLMGHGVPQDNTQASAWFLKAAEQGNSKAQLNLAASYANGNGVPRNYEEAYFWVSLAATSPTDNDVRQHALSVREQIATMLNKNDIKRAEKRVKEWLKDHPGIAQ